MDGFSLIDMLDPPTGVTDTGVSPRSETIAWEQVSSDFLNKMLDTAIAFGTDAFSATQLGQRVEQQAVQQRLGAMFQNPSVWIIGAVLIGLLAMMFARR